MIALEEEIKIELAIWIKTNRERVRMTLSEASRKANLPVILLQYWEEGYPLPIDMLIKLLVVYQVPAEVTAAKIKTIQRKLEKNPLK